MRESIGGVSATLCTDTGPSESLRPPVPRRRDELSGQRLPEQRERAVPVLHAYAAQAVGIGAGASRPRPAATLRRPFGKSQSPVVQQALRPG